MLAHIEFSVCAFEALSGRKSALEMGMEDRACEVCVCEECVCVGPTQKGFDRYCQISYEMMRRPGGIHLLIALFAVQ